ncbi:MAG: response regulator [Planctomycetota bacterium]|nr:response regulator [Planctomycetota bacterium]
MRYVLVTGFREKNYFLLKEKLEDENVAVKHATTGEGCISALDNQAVDVIISDLESPRPAGFEIIEHIKEHGLNIPVIVVSHGFLGDKDARQRALEEGAFATLEKPIILNDLYEAIETALGIKLSGKERRRFPRLPIYLEMDVTAVGTEVRIFKKTHTVDISLGGLCFEFDPCEQCTGYTAGAVHPDCLFSKFWVKDHASRTIDILLKTAVPVGAGPVSGPNMPRQDGVKLSAKVAHVIRERGKTVEYIGVRFAALDYSTREFLKEYLKKLVDWKRT